MLVLISICGPVFCRLDIVAGIVTIEPSLDGAINLLLKIVDVRVDPRHSVCKALRIIRRCVIGFLSFVHCGICIFGSILHISRKLGHRVE